jgi:hypothetical protein
MISPFNTRATPYCIHVLQLMNHRGWIQLILKKSDHVTMHHDKFLAIKPIDALISQIYS